MKEISLNKGIKVSFLSKSGEKRYMRYCQKRFGQHASQAYNQFIDRQTKEFWVLMSVFNDAITGPWSDEICFEGLLLSDRVEATLTKAGKENIKNYFYHRNTLDINYRDVVNKGKISLELWQLIHIFSDTFKSGEPANFTHNSIRVPDTIKEEQK